MKSSNLLQLSVFGALGAAVAVQSGAPSCVNPPSTLALSDPPYKNFFYSDCNVAAQAVVTSPLPDSDLKQIGPAYTAPSSSGMPPSVGVQGVLRLNQSAVLTLPILGSIRTIRDFVEGPSLLHPIIQAANNFAQDGTGAQVSRLWLDNVTTTTLHFAPCGSSNTSKVTVGKGTLDFTKGDYLVTAQMNYPQMTQLKPSAVLNSQSRGLTTLDPGDTKAVAFLSYSEKLLAGAWRFLTYFGRDSMITALLMEPILSQGNGSAMEAVLGAVLERINRTDGMVCHEETIGDYATFVNMQLGINNSDLGCTYGAIDSSYYLPVLMQRYFVQSPVGQQRWAKFSKTPAGSIDTHNQGLTWGDLALRNAEYIMSKTAAFVTDQTKENLLHLEADQPVGEWRDSFYGIGGGRIPYDVNTALAPAALRSIATLARSGIYPMEKKWSKLADTYAKVWEDKTLQFFQVTIPQQEAQSRIEQYSNRTTFAMPDNPQAIDSDVVFHAVSLDGYDNLTKVEVMNTDDCFRHFLLNTTNDAQLTSFVNQTASNVRRTFPAGLMTGASMVVANPAYGLNPVYAQNWTTGAYHGTVVWSWPLAMMAKGLELQMARCDGSASAPAFCYDSSVYDNVKVAYNTLWDSIDTNSKEVAGEVWSWLYKNGQFQVMPLGVMPPPPGVGGQTESDIRQLWSLAFMAVKRNLSYK
ncbi:hypothetical protein PENARI_c210G09360 [Penicillium arizonense]|uniref:Glycogen debranching enzyme n=1 Tax=Penicillium arizonense TaxID=1835702 RepID=A0A1F5KZY6_PENAI|nr:hypothetical protein PENARI_c210G09360 [Penicillium arizonense]OGE46522.1 hypothetical protein PENARI_c210G09360 [Penicillium arizonense]